MTHEEFDALLEEAFICGYNDACEEVCNEAHPLARAIYAADRFRNYLKYDDLNERSAHNRKTAAALGAIEAARKADVLRDKLTNGRWGKKINNYPEIKEKIRKTVYRQSTMNRAEDTADKKIAALKQKAKERAEQKRKQTASVPDMA